jgi:hypothetical protein
MAERDLSRSIGRELDRRLWAARRRVLAHGLLGLLAIVGAMLLLAAWALGTLAQAPAPLRLGLLLSVLAMSGLLVWALLLRPLRGLRDRAEFCRRLERGGGFANQLLAAEEAGRRPERWEQSPLASPELVRRVLARAWKLTTGLRLGELLPVPRAAWVLAGGLAAGCLAAVLLLLAPAELARGSGRLVRPWRSGSDRTATLSIEEGPRELVAGQAALLSALDFSSSADSVLCEVRSGTGLWRPVACTVEPAAETRPFRRWEARLAEVSEDFQYRFRRGGYGTPSRSVTVLHPPLLTAVSAELVPPAYTGLASRRLDPLPAQVEALAGSRLVWRATANHDLTTATVITTTGDTLALACRGDSVGGSWDIGGSLSYRFHLTDGHGLQGRSRLRYDVKMLADAEPLALLERKDGDGQLPVSGVVPLWAEAADDYGLARIVLQIRREKAAAPLLEPEADWESFVLWNATAAGDPPDAGLSPGEGPRSSSSESPPAESSPTGSPPREEPKVLSCGFGRLTVKPGFPESGTGLHRQGPLELDASELDLVPGDVLALRLEVLDNRQPGPPGRGRSRVVRLSIPTAAEVLSAQAEEGRAERQKLAELRDRGQSLQEDLDRLERELQKDPLPDWSRQQEIEAAVTRQQELQAELKELTAQIQQDLDTLLDNQLTSAELLDRMDQLSALLDEARNPELDEMIAKLQEAVAKLSAQEIERSVSEVAQDQQEMLRRLDQAVAMMRQLEREQELEGMVSLLARVLRQQQELLAASETPPGEADEEPEKTGRQEPTAQPDQAATDSLAAGEKGSADQERSEGQQEGQQQDQSGGQAPRESPVSDEELAARQQTLAQQLAELEQRLDEALERLQQEKEAGGGSTPGDEEYEEALRRAREELSRGRPGQSMQEAARSLQDRQSEKALQQQRQAMRDLAALYHVLLTSQQGMQMALQQHQVTSLRRLAADLLVLSDGQEEIADIIPGDLHGVRARELTRRQFRILRQARRLRDGLQEISAGAPLRVLRLQRRLDDLLAELDRTVRSLEAGRGAAARSTARSSLGSMNEIVISLLTQAEKSCQGGGEGSSCSMPNLAQSLRDLARQQAGLNGLTEQLRRQLAERGLSQELRSQMQRLEAEQEGLAGSARGLDEMSRQLPQGERPLGDLGQVADDMEEVSRQLSDGLVDEQTLLRQERILSRLLDAHNSARRQDFAQRRESRTARDVYAEGRQPGLDSNQEESERAAEARYQPVQKAPLEYRELVRRYFRAIQGLREGGEAAP